MSKKNLWILTEERPKEEVIRTIVEKFAKDKNLKLNIINLKIKPIIEKRNFQFKYIIEGVKINEIKNIYLKIISGSEGSFVDFLVFHQESEPKNVDLPIYVIEETKTNPAESRNVAVFQRATKFVFADLFANTRQAEKIMLYSIRKPYFTLPPTFIFGIKAMKTLGVTIIGLKEAKEGCNEGFESVDELIKHKNAISTKRIDNTPLSIVKTNKSGVYRISGKLVKSGQFSHDPNIGAVILIARLIKKLDPETKEIIVYNHGLTQRMVNNSNNKFVKIANKFGIKLEDLILHSTELGDQYWKYNYEGEKIVSIFVHLLLQYNETKIIYENHAGCEQGYFEFPNKDLESIKKKMGKPDLIFLDTRNKVIYLIEAEMATNAFGINSGVNQLKKFTEVEKEFCASYVGYAYKRCVILYGDIEPIQKSNKIIFQLKTNGELICYDSCPKLMKDIITKFK